jgi:broad specificity phosphatase PhoE/8-oxo-dGTP pyrophosphatase MutT (NUDIX family)
MAVIPAAGTLPWRRRADGTLEVALVHRPKYNDWSWTKGKLDPGEDWPVAAVRETQEETGLDVRLGQPLPSTTYTVVDRGGHLAIKVVHYWAAQVVGGHGELRNEIDDVVWLDVSAATSRLDYSRDRDQLRALVRADAAGRLDTWPLVIVRHGRAKARSAWDDEDWLRPLDKVGHEQARSLIPLLAGFGVQRVISSSSTRCVDTVSPYAESIGAKVRLRRSLSEESYADSPSRAVDALSKIVASGVPTAVCSHGPVLPALLLRLHEAGAAPEGADRVTREGHAAAQDTLVTAADLGMAKGEIIVCHVVGSGDSARIVAAERHHTEPA